MAVEPFWWAGFGAIGKWAGALASTAAVIVALRLAARRESREDRAKARAASVYRRRVYANVKELQDWYFQRETYRGNPEDGHGGHYVIPPQQKANMKALVDMTSENSEWLADSEHAILRDIAMIVKGSSDLITVANLDQMFLQRNKLSHLLTEASMTANLQR